MTRLIDADAVQIQIDKYAERIRRLKKGKIPKAELAVLLDCKGYVDNTPTVEAIPIEWIKNLIEEDRECAKKAKEGKNEKVFRFHKRLEICISQMLFDWEFENGKYKEFEGELWQE